MANFNKLRDRKVIREVNLDFGDGILLWMKVNVNAMTYKLQREMAAAIKEGDADRVAVIFFEPIDEWDMQDDDGNVLPLSPASVEELGAETVNQIFTKVAEAINPKSATSNS